ncbi:CinA family protein [Pedobacter sp.]|uniref:CinA family protein n=1 Tax=Pedobacter sp. TaxID=1411316 RepID=UPI0031E35F18
MAKEIFEAAGKILIERKLTIAFAESATAGRLAAEFSLITDAGKFLRGAVVCYDANLKVELLKVKKELIDKYTPESMEVTRAIALGLRSLIEADIYIGVTGLPAPGGSENSEKPVGTMFLHAIKDNEIIFAERCNFLGEPEAIIMATINHCAKLLLEYLEH